eukprot:TRINITY_DN13088_c0_g1_i10.p1 TRINITY_DN13088_c0_g1~~TRINITY_DN13088_c0_g1_i10.p1  ORF type:complete len:227 (+),score=12.03 TRINITY_DN13088_c0_g1_i10:158-838(+)
MRSANPFYQKFDPVASMVQNVSGSTRKFSENAFGFNPQLSTNPLSTTGTQSKCMPYTLHKLPSSSSTYGTTPGFPAPNYVASTPTGAFPPSSSLHAFPQFGRMSSLKSNFGTAVVSNTTEHSFPFSLAYQAEASGAVSKMTEEVSDQECVMHFMGKSEFAHSDKTVEEFRLECYAAKRAEKFGFQNKQSAEFGFGNSLGNAVVKPGANVFGGAFSSGILLCLNRHR